jgi:4-methylaminobutanoate oxidase (formaldehyde-forming)
MTEPLPAHARAVIVGGGIVGCSVAYHLARLGWSDVVLLERGSLSCGTTWHAAGLVGQLRSSLNMTSLIRYSTQLYASLEAETGQATGWKRCGSLSVARTPERMTQLRRTAALAGAFGVEAHVISLAEAGRRWPLMRTDDLAGAVWLPGDGKANPSDLTMALARGARRRGVRIIERARVSGVLVERGRAAGVRVGEDLVRSEVVVACAGLWSRELAAACGVNVPLHAVEHMYIVTRPMPGVAPDLPVLRDPDGMVYFKEEVGGLVMGGFEPVAKPWGVDGVPGDPAFTLLEEDWDQFRILMDSALVRVPALETAGVHRLLNGPESFTPDNSYILGEAPELPGFFVAAGFNSAGIATAGGAGRALAHWIVGGYPEADLWPADIRRFAPCHRNVAWLRERIREAPGIHYAMAWPQREFERGRDLRRSPLWERHAARRACFGQKLGWERPNWFAPEGMEPRPVYAWDRPNWLPAVAAEHRAAREAVAVWDQTSLAKFLVQGPDVEAVLQRACANDVAVPAGRIVHTGVLNERGGYESDLTVTRLDGVSYLVTGGAAQATRDLDLLRRRLAGSGSTITDITSAWAVLGVMGPRSRQLLARLTDADLGNAAFPFSTLQEIPLGTALVRALRITGVGELGWELHVPVESAALLYERLMDAGADLGVRDAGFYALETLRLEKAHRAWGRDISPDDTPIEAGLELAVAWDKPVAFTGRDALLRQRERGPRGVTRRLVIFTIDDGRACPVGDEPILRDGAGVGWLSSAGWGHTLGQAVGLGYVRHPDGVDRAFVESGSYEIDIAGQRFPATPRLRPPFDPEGLRPRA